MSKYRTIDVWNEFYGRKESVYDYAGRLMKRSACGNPNSAYHPTIDHIRPLSAGGSDVLGNIEICIVIPTKRKRTASLIGKRTENTFAQNVSEAHEQNMKLWNCNLDHIQAIKSNSKLTVTDGHEISISLKRFQDFKKAYMKFSRRRLD